MKITAVFIIAVIFISCSPLNRYNSKFNNLYQYSEKLKEDGATLPERFLLVFTKAKDKFPDYSSQIDALIIEAQYLIEYEEKGILTESDTKRFIKLQEVFWKEVKNDAIIEEQSQAAALMYLGESMQRTGQRMENSYRPINCTSQAIGNSIYTNCY